MDKKPYVLLEWDRPRTLRYGMNALAMLEDMMGMTVAEFSAANLGIKHVRTMLYCGLWHEDRTLDLQKVGELVDEYCDDMADLANKISEAMQAAFGGKKSKGPTGANG